MWHGSVLTLRPTAARRQIEARRPFRRDVRWRTGIEGRISCLKRDFRLNRTRIDGIDGARTRCGHCVFNHNLVKIGGLVEQPAGGTRRRGIGVLHAGKPSTKHSNRHLRRTHFFRGK
jgi:IS5 family transposase